MGKSYDQGVSNGHQDGLAEDVASIKKTLTTMFGPEGTCQKLALTVARLGATVKVLLVMFAALIALNVQTWRGISSLRGDIGRIQATHTVPVSVADPGPPTAGN